jgi:hypothetical protein
MLWVIGDIHGMYDPLKRLLCVIRFMEKTTEPVDKIIFIGDYIDHGPCSKEVIDSIIKLEYEKVCLMGNHEDMALRFISNDKLFLERNNDAWFFNGAMDTYRSIYFSRKRLLKREEEIFDKNRIEKYKGLELPRKYENFIRKLVYTHQESFNVNGCDITFSFFHSLPNMEYPFEEQKIKTYTDFSKYIYNKSELITNEKCKTLDSYKMRLIQYYNRELEYSFLWERRYSNKFDFKGQVVIHGHTPTYKYNERSLADDEIETLYNKQFETFDGNLLLPFIFSRSDGAEYLPLPKSHDTRRPSEAGYHYKTDNINGIEAINVDTGAVYGGALTALGLSASYLAEGKMPLLTVPTSKGQRQEATKFELRYLYFDKLGRPSP